MDSGEDADGALHVGDIGDEEAALGTFFTQAAGQGVLGGVGQDGARGKSEVSGHVYKPPEAV